MSLNIRFSGLCLLSVRVIGICPFVWLASFQTEDLNEQILCDQNNQRYIAGTMERGLHMRKGNKEAVHISWLLLGEGFVIQEYILEQG